MPHSSTGAGNPYTCRCIDLSAVASTKGDDPVVCMIGRSDSESQRRRNNRIQLERTTDKCQVSFGTAVGVGDKLSAGSLGCGNDPVEALITAQRIPARIEAEIAVCRAQSGKRRHSFELLECAVTLASPRVNQCQIGNPGWSVEGVLGNRPPIDPPSCLADRFFFTAKPGIKPSDSREVVPILGFVTPHGVPFLARRCKHRECLLLIAARSRNLPISPTLGRLP